MGFPRAITAFLLLLLPSVATAQLLHAPLQDNAGSQALTVNVGTAGELYNNVSNLFTSTVSVLDGPGTKYPRSLYLNQSGVLDWAAFPCVVDTSQPHSYCVWFKGDNAPGSGTITHLVWSTNDLFTLAWDHTNASYRHAATRAPNSFPFASAGTAAAGNWTHYAVAWNGTHMITFKNGVQQTSTATATGGASTTHVILANRQAHDRGAKGKYADLRVYQSALDASAIAAIIADKDLPAVSPIPSLVFQISN